MRRCPSALQLPNVEASNRPLARVAWELLMLHTCAWATLAWHGSAHTSMGRAAQKRTKESMKGGMLGVGKCGAFT